MSNRSLDGKVTVYAKDGEDLVRFSIDAKEIVRSQPELYSLAPWPAEPEPVAEAAEPEDAPRRGPGRLRKAEG